MAANIPSFTLNDGTKMPSVGMGCWMGQPGGGEVVEIMCKNALKHGYRHFDTAAGYANEQHVGKALRESGIPRDQLYITTKLANEAHHRVREAFEESLQNLDCDYIDMYLMHWPQAVVDGVGKSPSDSPTIVDTWKEMEKLLTTGKVKTLGVSNFSIKTLEQLLASSTVVPATNQVELHPCLPSEDLKAYCDKKGIILTAYSPLGQGRPVQDSASSGAALLVDEDVTKIATEHGATPAQVVLSWGVQRGTVVIPKSVSEERMKSNIALLKLTPENMAALDALHKKPGFHRSLLGYHNAKPGSVFGWTYEQLGWPMGPGGVVVA